MSKAIISHFRSLPQLKGNTLLIATELAHRLNPQGYGRVAYQFLAWKAHCSKRTAIRQMHILVTHERLVRKTVIRTKHGNAWNLYQYIGPRLSGPAPPATTQGDTASSTLPTPKATEEKSLSLKEEIRRLRGGMTLLTPGSERYQSCLEDLQRLEALARPGSEGAVHGD